MRTVENAEPIRFISFEGPDGSGKSTQIHRVQEWLNSRGVKSLLTYEPGDTDFGQIIRDLLLHGKFKLDKYTELFLYLADRREHILNIIKPALSNGYFVLCDRYIDSTYAYQGFGHGISIDLIDSILSYILDGVIPSLTFFLDLPPTIGLSRLNGFDNIEREDILFHKRVSKGYQYLAEKYSDRIVTLSINEYSTADAIFEKIISHISKTWPSILARQF